MIRPGISSKSIPRKIHSVTLINVLRKGRQRLRNTAYASFSLTGRRGAAVNCVMITAVTPEMTPAEKVVAANFNKLRIPIVENTTTFSRVPPGGEYLYQTYAPIKSRLVIIIGTCAIRLSLRNFGKYSL